VIATGSRWAADEDIEGNTARPANGPLTEAEHRAARRAIEAAYGGDEPRVLFHELVREEQRRMLQVVRSDDQ